MLSDYQVVASLLHPPSSILLDTSVFRDRNRPMVPRSDAATRSRWEMFTVATGIPETEGQHRREKRRVKLIIVDEVSTQTPFHLAQLSSAIEQAAGNHPEVDRYKHRVGHKYRSYKWTCVSSCTMLVDGIIYRLTVIAYTRPAPPVV